MSSTPTAAAIAVSGARSRCDLSYTVSRDGPGSSTTGAPSHFLNSQLLRLILEKYSLFRLSKVDLGNCILSKVLLKTRKLGNKSTKN